MKNVFHHVARHAKRVGCHIKKHHKKYLCGLFGGFAVVKLFLLVLWLSVVEYSYNSTFAQLASGCVLTGEYYTGEYETWWYLTGQELTWGYLTWWTFVDCVTIPGYFTGGTLNESGELVDQIRVEESQSWCVLTGQELTGQTLTEWYVTWSYLTGWYRTWGTIFCNQGLGTGDVVQTWNNQTGTNQQQTIITSWNGICESGDVIFSAPISWSVVRDIFTISWAYSWTDCLLSGLSLQLRDHNNQRISLGAFASWVATYAFDSKMLYNFQQSGLYHIIWTGGSGQQLYLYTGTYTWTYARLFTWYKFRLLTVDQTPLYETPLFTIDNDSPILTGITLFSNWSTTWYLNVSGVVTLAFTASEELSGVQVTLWSGRFASSSVVSWLLYRYTRNITSLDDEGNLTAYISFADNAGNTGAVVYSWLLVFDKTRPVVTGFAFSEYTWWLSMNFNWSEPIRYVITYWMSWWTLVSDSNVQYLTVHHISLSWVIRDQMYVFNLNVFDRAGNSRSVTGDVMQTNLWVIVSHVYIVPVVDEAVLSWNLSSLALILRAEVEKFNACKNALSYTPIELKVRSSNFILQMPLFKKSQIKTLVNAFTLFVLDKIKHNYGITSDEVTEITKKFDSFLIILKLLRDDDNTCKQNLSNYHISQFKRALEEYKINLD